MSSESDPPSPTRDISECLEALRLAVGNENHQSKQEDTQLCNEDINLNEQGKEEAHLQQQIDLIETIKHEVTSNHDNTTDESPLSPQPLLPQPSFNNYQHLLQGTPAAEYHRTCREEAYYYPSDITVDELAGYLDELLYLPKPMSDMAELMYT